MGTIHKLIETHGIEAARATATNAVEQQAIETAFAIMADDQPRVGIMHAGFAMTALPHKQISEALWTRQGGPIKLHVESGRDSNQNLVGVPYGSVARMILLYLQTEAIKTKSRYIELGRSMNKWLSNMGIDGGGRQYSLVREQSTRLSLCRLTFFRECANATFVTNGSFVRDAILTTNNCNQINIWRDAVTLDEGFYKSLLEHPMPVREAAIREIGGRSMAIDVYIWLAYRLHHLGKPTPISWPALYQQFGGGYNQLRQFKAKFKEPLTLALAAYPEARVVADDAGLTLYPSAPPVPDRGFACIR